MKVLLVAAMVLGTSGAALAMQPAKEQTVVSVSGEPHDFTVERGDVVRFTPSAPAGVAVRVKSSGPIRLVRKARVRQLVDGEPMIGSAGVEYEFSTTGRGKAKVIFTMQGGPVPKPKSVEYQFTIE